MEKGEEYKGEWGDTVLILNASEALDVVYYIDDILMVDEMPIRAFVARYKPTGRVNKALKTLFNENNFERKKS